METVLLRFLQCPTCAAPLHVTVPSDANGHVDTGSVACTEGHDYPVVGGVPILLPRGADANAAAKTIEDSFGTQWDHFDYDERTWGATVEQRLDEFLRQVDLPAEALQGKLVLDAGCGNGALSRAISSLGCEVVALDITDQPLAANAHFHDRPEGETHFVQADLMRPAIKPASFDVIFCAGVLHHTPDTKATFDQMMPALAPACTVFVWLYHHVPGRLLAIKSKIRSGLSRLPARPKSFAVACLLPQAMLRQKIRARRGTLDDRENFTWRERYVVLLDSYTPRYRWEHTQEELAGWYAEWGLTDIHTTEVGPWGFGMVARRPHARAS